ncbi:MAG: hypothetical protein Udaeo2_25620 [Candidatus Udaeobacter sp.]|nr:MAG: hypothetical protein Udaeo2_25620 [Candidatus Udaeobacter sp.]
MAENFGDNVLGCEQVACERQPALVVGQSDEITQRCKWCFSPFHLAVNAIEPCESASKLWNESAKIGC